MKEILFLNMPDFDRAYLYHKEMGAGMGYKGLRPKKGIEKDEKNEKFEIRRIERSHW